MDKNKVRRIKMDICDTLDGITKEDLGKSSLVEHYKNLAKLHCALDQIEESEQRKEYSQSMGYMPGAYRTDGQEWGAWDDGMSYRGGRRSPSTGRYMSYGMGTAKEEVRRLMDDPNISREDREALKRAMEQMR